MTKARALAVIRKGLLSCLGSSLSLPLSICKGAIQGPGTDSKTLFFSFFICRYKCDPAVSNITEHSVDVDLA